MALHNTKIDLSKDAREKLIELLNSRLADASDLKSQAKQAHWNVKGMSFIALHELFDAIATAVEAHIDLIAERITTLGGTAMGTVRLAAQNSKRSGRRGELLRRWRRDHRRRILLEPNNFRYR